MTNLWRSCTIFSKSIREDYLHQNAFHDVDTFSSMNKQYRLMKLILAWYDESKEAVAKGASFNKLAVLPVRETIGRFKYVEEKEIDEVYEDILKQLNAEVSETLSKEDEDDD